MKKFFSVLAAAAVTLGTTAAYAAPADDTYAVSEIGSDSFDREAAEQLYIDRMFGIDVPVPYANHGSELLTGSAKEVYEQAKVYLKEIADGKRTRTNNLSVSASQAITVDDILAAWSCLIADCPEYLYWSTGGVGYYTGTGSTNALTLYVTSEYSVSGANNDVEINTSKMDKARKAVDNAKSIAAKYANAKPYEKVYGYANEICALTDYDYSYQNHDLVNVFDGDPSTKVVCEGYARAFQYLCDLGGIDCYNVSGSDHRWNIVVLDGKSYHVDCTWADGFPIGVVETYHPYILRGASYSDGKRVQFDYKITHNNLIWTVKTEVSDYNFDEQTISIYPESILKVSTEDYVPKNVEEGGDKEDDKGDENEEEVTATEIKVEVNLPETNAPDASGLSVQIADGEPVAIIDNKLDITTLDDGDYKMTFSANNCAPRTYTVKIENSTANLANVELNLCGDMDGDGVIELTDVMDAYLTLRKPQIKTEYQRAVADANQKGGLNISDVMDIFLHLRGKSSLWK